MAVMNEIAEIMNEYKYAELTGRIIGCAMEVHNHLGNGFHGPPKREVIYQRALAQELELQGLGFAREFEMPIFYKEAQIGTRRVDFLVNDIIAVEIKALVELDKVHLAQGLNYLEAYNLEVGLLLNFGNRRLQFHRLQNKKFKPS